MNTLFSITKVCYCKLETSDILENSAIPQTPCTLDHFSSRVPIPDYGQHAEPHSFKLSMFKLVHSVILHTKKKKCVFAYSAPQNSIGESVNTN